MSGLRFSGDDLARCTGSCRIAPEWACNCAPNTRPQSKAAVATTGGESEALEWLDKKISEEYAGAWPGYMKHARTLKAMLAQRATLLGALKDLLADCVEYARINNLSGSDGKPATNHAMRRAADAIAQAEAAAGCAAPKPDTLEIARNMVQSPDNWPPMRVKQVAEAYLALKQEGGS